MYRGIEVQQILLNMWVYRAKIQYCQLALLKILKYRSDFDSLNNILTSIADKCLCQFGLLPSKGIS